MNAAREGRRTRAAGNVTRSSSPSVTRVSLRCGLPLQSLGNVKVAQTYTVF
jgi:hypothetical protein